MSESGGAQLVEGECVGREGEKRKEERKEWHVAGLGVAQLEGTQGLVRVKERLRVKAEGKEMHGRRRASEGKKEWKAGRLEI